ncbi:GTP 3',8-cyclase MoaA [Candidatus Woesearchaeota archaeon]|nr:GTP 3',8-cyclase MoaA [Candidatus Woesearchaeota archaeon]
MRLDRISQAIAEKPRPAVELRVSVTQRCNLDCAYCHREGEPRGQRPEDELPPRRIAAIAASLTRYGIRRVKITGGEPLMRRDIADIVSALAAVQGIEEVSMTTNGTLLAEHAEALRRAGLARINIGCDSVNEALPKNWKTIERGIVAAERAGFADIKLNMVVLKGINDDQVKSMISCARDLGCTLQLLELMHTREPGFDAYYAEHHYPLDSIERDLAKRAVMRIERRPGARTVYRLPSVDVEVVRQNSALCARCDKLRLTSDGRIRPCLRRDESLPAPEGSDADGDD